ncbi:MAG TPA: hypothetical protein QF813_10890 [Alphaproteobacteria bacterium]|nr:hypothetical protein [Alphaproteobacteria bacterium]
MRFAEDTLDDTVERGEDDDVERIEGEEGNAAGDDTAMRKARQKAISVTENAISRIIATMSTMPTIRWRPV